MASVGRAWEPKRTGAIRKQIPPDRSCWAASASRKTNRCVIKAALEERTLKLARTGAGTNTNFPKDRWVFTQRIVYVEGPREFRRGWSIGTAALYTTQWEVENRRRDAGIVACRLPVAPGRK
ncbi:hypothetical protein MKZ38_000094 [Zalerion maritima]|uniref:Uncharacterized protein n=1 Tax=Zalerion maritima TaxID=339359 RepID=A0AAD5RRZ8_9PEZI|nr:hypothetical protein MKZ38_000094 [Zalerion maritima]